MLSEYILKWNFVTITKLRIISEGGGIFGEKFLEESDLSDESESLNIYLTLFNLSANEKGSTFALPKHRGVEQWQLVGLITQRSEVRVLPPQPQSLKTNFYFWVDGFAISCSLPEK